MGEHTRDLRACNFFNFDESVNWSRMLSLLDNYWSSSFNEDLSSSLPIGHKSFQTVFAHWEETLATLCESDRGITEVLSCYNYRTLGPYTLSPVDPKILGLQ